MKSKVAVWTAVLGLLIFGFVFWAAERTPHLDDDYRYVFSFYSDAPLQKGEMPSWASFARVPNKCARLVEDVTRHYRTECGRFMTACVERPLSALPRGLFASVAAVSFLLVLLLTARLAGVKENLPLYASGFFVVSYDWSTCAWLAGGCNYLLAAVAGLAAVFLFLRPRLAESAFRYRNVAFWGLVPLGFVLAGWHEQLSISLCLLMAVYWANEFFVQRKFALNGRLLLCLGFGLGALAVTFAPGTTGRVSTTGFFDIEVSVAFALARKVKCLLRLFGTNPAVLLALVVSLSFVFSRKMRERCDVRTRWLLLAGWIMFAETCALTDGQQRTAWFAGVFSVMMTAVAAPLLRDWVRPGLWRVGRVAVYLLFASVFAVTAVRVREKANAHEADIAALKASPWCMVEFRPDLMRRLPWLDRSVDYRLTHGRPENWLRIPPARFYGLQDTFVLNRDEIAFFLREDLPEHMKRTALPHCPGWSEIPGTDLIFSRYEGSAPAVVGQHLCVRPTYEKGPRVKHDFAWLKRRLTRSDWTYFSRMSPDDEMAANQLLKGFILMTPTGAYNVLMHSRFIPRSRIRALKFEKADENKYLWNS